MAGQVQKTIKLNWQKVGEIRRLHATGSYSYAQLGAIYGVCKDNVKKIIKGEIWQCK